MRILSRLFDLDPLIAEMEQWLLWVAFSTAMFGVVFWFWLPLPTPALMHDIANIGIVLVLAYVVEAAWLTPHVVESEDDEGELGLLLGMGIAGMLGVVIAVLLAAHRAAGHGNRLDDFGLGWCIASLLALATMVVLQPLLVHIWEGRQNTES